MKSRDYDFAASRAYYSMHYVATAALLEKGISTKTHSGAIATFYEYYVKSGLVSKSFHQNLHAAFEKRQEGDYGYARPFPAGESRLLIKQAEEFLAAVAPLLKSQK